MTDILDFFDPEDIFPPVPGGMVDTARQKTQADSDQLNALNEAEETPGKSRFSVPVQNHGAELARARTFSVSTTGGNPIVELLGRDDNRNHAVIMTLDEPVVVSFAQTAAEDPRNAVNAAGLSANGFVLPVNVPVSLPAKGVIYCTAIADAITPPSVPATTVYAQSPYAYPVKVVISGGTVTTILVNGQNVGSGDGTYYVPAFGAIAVTYSSLPTWTWGPLSVATRVSVAAFSYSEG